MFKLQLIGFLLVAVFLVGFVDYNTQSRIVGLRLGQMELASYFDTVKQRYGGLILARDMQKQSARAHLPEPPEGWTRREWADGDNARILAPKYEAAVDKALEIEIPLRQGQTTAIAEAKAQSRKSEVWVYEKGDEIIALRAAYNNRADQGEVFELALIVILAGMHKIEQSTGYAFIQGVAYGEIRYPGVIPDDENDKTHRLFAASLEDEVRVGVRALASDVSIRLLLEAIDYDGLNAMLERPLANIGSEAQKYDQSLQAEIAQKSIDQKRETIRAKYPAAERRLNELME